jgi:uncharacterized FAD-dependent dehydrogenase
MVFETEIAIRPEWLHDDARHRRLIADALGVAPPRITHVEMRRRSVDARRRQPRFVVTFAVWVDEPHRPDPRPELARHDVTKAPPALIAGFGPAGMFAALRLVALGIKPIVLERGKEVRARRRDLAVLNRDGLVDPDSNYCFGEGGAGTFSDGKLYTRSKKRGDVRRILDLFVEHGASADVLVDAHPHIGTNKLPRIVEAIRHTVLASGGEIHFGTKVTGFVRDGDALAGVRTAGGDTVHGRALILATGHSARDVFALFRRDGLAIDAKSLAMGVRVEHPQSLIDRIQYRCDPRPENLPAAAYSVVQRVDDRGVYSFCMCPGGIICPASTAEGEVVVNGWSPSKRDSPFANAGIVVELRPEDLVAFASEGVFAALAFQQRLEQAACAAGGGRQVAPAQRLADFVDGRASGTLPPCSYVRGLEPADLAEVLPAAMHRRLREALRAFGHTMRGFLTNDAVVVGVESRTSSPVRIPREAETLMHPQVRGLFPCGEGAGYAGGIMSAAMDGERCADAVGRYLAPAVAAGADSRRPRAG